VSEGGPQGIFIGDLIDTTDDAGVDATGDELTSVTVDLRRADLYRWKLACEYNPAVQVGKNYANVLFDRIKNHAAIKDLPDDVSVFVGITIAGFAYGGLHCLAWNAPFATETQRILWRVSSVTVMSTGVLLLLLVLFVGTGDNGGLIKYLEDVQESVDSWLGTQSLLGEARKGVRKGISALVFKPLLWVSKLICLACIMFYCLARMYLVVECFIGLFHLPASVFQVPVWSRYVPHIS
jgi:hypothetical protein